MNRQEKHQQEKEKARDEKKKEQKAYEEVSEQRRPPVRAVWLIVVGIVLTLLVIYLWTVSV